MHNASRSATVPLHCARFRGIRRGPGATAGNAPGEAPPGTPGRRRSAAVAHGFPRAPAGAPPSGQYKRNNPHEEVTVACARAPGSRMVTLIYPRRPVVHP
ncbi:hypothetical protein GCM10010145_23660 [Streptomyces ruber]|uniref:Uncharacterized protein n=2 Tax=Streptomyces TaxID=1883 RepID=A0A918BAU0_9ACTN|nr:hypothetical protein GCM10010145_23660 [Streptomyces ruber]